MKSRPSGGDSPRRRNLLAALALALVTLAAYSNSFDTGFPLDNKRLLLQDSRVQQATGENIALIFQHTYWWPYGESYLYRPFTTLSYLFNYAILGNQDHAAGYHWINFFLHAGNVLLVYALALRFLREFWRPVFVAGLWAVHPVLTESVTNIVGRADLLAGLALLGGFLMYLKSTETAGGRRVAWLAGLAAATTAGVFSKESAVAVLGVMALYEFTWWKERRQGRALVLGAIAVALPFQLMSYLRSAALAGAPPMNFPFFDNPLTGAGFLTARLTAIRIMARYLGLLVWPARLSSDYSYRQIPLATGSFEDWIGWLAVAATAAAALLLYRRNRTLFFFAGFAFVTFLPASNLAFPIGTIMAERFLYLPAIGLAACLVASVYAAGRRAAAAAPVVLCLIAVAFAARTWVRNLDWRDDAALGTAAVQASPLSFKTHSLLALAWSEADPAHSRLDRVIEEAEKGLAILEGLPDARNNPRAYSHASAYYMTKGDLELRRDANGNLAPSPESMRAYQRSVQLLLRSIAINGVALEKEMARGGPGLADIAAGSAGLYTQLSAAYLRLMETPDALAAVVRARALDPMSSDVYRQLSRVMLAAGRPDDAAVALMQGVLVTSDQGLRGDLIKLYRNGLDLKGCAVMPGANGDALNPGCETVHGHLCSAMGETMRLRLETKRDDLAESLKKTAVKDFGCPAGPLEQMPSR